MVAGIISHKDSFAHPLHNAHDSGNFASETFCTQRAINVPGE